MADSSTLTMCDELAACGALRRSAFLSRLSQHVQQMQPYEAVKLINSLARLGGAFDLSRMLRQLLPDSGAAAQLLCDAACSRHVCIALLDSCSAGQAAVPTGCPVQAVLQALLGVVFDTAAVSSMDTTGSGAAAATGFAAPAADAGLQQYITHVLQQLQELAHQAQALAVCLLQAAAACGITCDADIVSGWLAQQLRRQLAAQLHKPRNTTPAAHTAATPVETPTASTSLASSRGWGSLALQPLCWPLMLQPTLQCMQLPDVLQVLQGQLSTAAGSVTGMLQMVEALAAVGSAGHTAGVVQMVASSLAAAAGVGNIRDSLAPLLLGAQLLCSGWWSREQYRSMLGQAAASCQESQPASSLPVLFKAFNLLMPTAASHTLEVQVEVLRHLQPQLGPVLQAEASKVISLLKDVCLQRQQLQKKQQHGRQGTRVISRSAYEGYTFYLNQYMQLSEDPQGRRLTHVHVAKWRLMDAPTFVEAWIQQPPDTPERAQACLKYIQELQSHRLCAADRAQAYKTSCFALGINFPSQHGTAQQGPLRAAGPLEALRSLLDRLPVVVSSGSHSALTILLGRIAQHVQSLLQPDAAQQPLQAPALHAVSAPPLAKRQRTHPAPAALAPAAEGAAGSSAEHCGAVLELLLIAYGSALSRAAAGQPSASDWRVEFVRVLQQLPALHPALLQLLLGSLRGTGCAAAEAPQEALRHGSLLAWLSASQLQQLPFLSSQAHAPLSTAAAASPLFTWHFFEGRSTNSACSSSSSEGAAACGPSSGGDQACGQLAGLQLVQYLLGSTSMQTALERCCAASLWAAYVGCVRKCMLQWCTGPAGPFCNASTAGTSPGVLTAPQQAAVEAPGADKQQQLLAYVPLQLAVLLKQLAAGLTEDLQQAAEAAADDDGADRGPGDAVSLEVSQVALQACTRALKAQPVKWACQLHGI